MAGNRNVQAHSESFLGAGGGAPQQTTVNTDKLVRMCDPNNDMETGLPRGTPNVVLERVARLVYPSK